MIQIWRNSRINLINDQKHTIPVLSYDGDDYLEFCNMFNYQINSLTNSVKVIKHLKCFKKNPDFDSYYFLFSLFHYKFKLNHKIIKENQLAKEITCQFFDNFNNKHLNLQLEFVKIFINIHNVL